MTWSEDSLEWIWCLDMHEPHLIITDFLLLYFIEEKSRPRELECLRRMLVGKAPGQMGRGFFMVLGRGGGSNFCHCPWVFSVSSTLFGIIPRKSLKLAVSVFAPNHLLLRDVRFSEPTVSRCFQLQLLGGGWFQSTGWDTGYRAYLESLGKSFALIIVCHSCNTGSISSGLLPKSSAPFLAALLGNVIQHSAEEKHRRERQKGWFRLSVASKFWDCRQVTLPSLSFPTCQMGWFDMVSLWVLRV